MSVGDQNKEIIYFTLTQQKHKHLMCLLNLCQFTLKTLIIGASHSYILEMSLDLIVLYDILF